MRRADRLFKVIQIIRRRKVTTAAQLARELDVSERTVYRDVRDLVLSGVPIQSEAGVGYAMARGFDLPPLMFTEDEITALVLGMRIVKGRADGILAQAAEDVLTKVESVLPKRLRGRIAETALFAPTLISSIALRTNLGPLRAAIENRRKVKLVYESGEGEETERIIWPLAIYFWSVAWTVGAWCELRADFRNFRIDRIVRLEALDKNYPEEQGRSLRDYMRRQEERFLS